MNEKDMLKIKYQKLERDLYQICRNLTSLTQKVSSTCQVIDSNLSIQSKGYQVEELKQVKTNIDENYKSITQQIIPMIQREK